MKTSTVLLWLSSATLFAAIVAALYAARTYRLKRGIDVRGDFGIASSIAAEDRYVHEVTLENMKDRAVVIFSILLELDHGYYVELDDFRGEPLILGPFEAVTRKYEPLDLYSAGMRRVFIDSLFAKRVRQRLVLATSRGRYNVKSHLDRWHPMVDFFHNHLTAIIRPLRSTYEGTAYGSGTKYVVKVTGSGGDTEVVPIHPRDYQLKTFRGFDLTEDSLQSREALEAYLLERAMEGKLPCSDVEVFDLEQWRQETYTWESEAEALTLKRRGWFVYHVLGKAVTRLDNIRLWWKNRRNRRRQRSKQS